MLFYFFPEGHIPHLDPVSVIACRWGINDFISNVKNPSRDWVQDKNFSNRDIKEDEEEEEERDGPLGS